MNVSNNSDDNIYALHEDINGPVYAAALSVELVLAFVPNLFIIVYSLCHPVILKQPSMIFLTKLALVSMLSAITYVPFVIITDATGEWIFGRADEPTDGVCQFAGFMYDFTDSMSIHVLAIISFDQYLFIVKPLIYRQYMKSWTAFTIVTIVTIYVALHNIVPFFGFGGYTFLPILGACASDWIEYPDFVAILAVTRALPMIIIVITSLWTFFFTRNFIRQEKKRKVSVMRSTSIIKNEQSIYSKRIRNLVGIFGALLTVMLISYSPFIIVATVGPIAPIQLWPTVVVLYFVNSFATPIIQIYFRRDLQAGITNGARKIKALFSKLCHVAYKRARGCCKHEDEDDNVGHTDQSRSASVDCINVN